MFTNDIAVKDVLRMFDLGMDTETIAKVLQVEEHWIYNILAFAKSVEKNFGSDAQIVRTSTKCEQHLEKRSRSDVPLFQILELAGVGVQGNSFANEKPKTD